MIMISKGRHCHDHWRSSLCQIADLKGFCRHGALPVGLVTEHSPEVSNNIHNPEYQAAGTKQNQVFD